MPLLFYLHNIDSLTKISTNYYCRIIVSKLNKIQPKKMPIIFDAEKLSTEPISTELKKWLNNDCRLHSCILPPVLDLAVGFSAWFLPFIQRNT